MVECTGTEPNDNSIVKHGDDAIITLASCAELLAVRSTMKHWQLDNNVASDDPSTPAGRGNNCRPCCVAGDIQTHCLKIQRLAGFNGWQRS